MFTVSSAAENTALTTLEEVKSQLSITASDEDEYLEKAILKSTAVITAWLNVASAVDGSKTIGSETLVETFRLNRCQDELLLSRPLPFMPVTITSVTENGVAVAADEYELHEGGILYRLTSDDEPAHWPTGKIVVTFTAGWLLPDDDARNLPYDIEEAAISLIKATRFSRSRDPMLRSENILESLYSYSLFEPSNDGSSLQIEVKDKLSPYRNVNI